MGSNPPDWIRDRSLARLGGCSRRLCAVSVKADATVAGLVVDVLFDKLIEERETQAAESWRILRHESAVGSKELWRSLRFSHHQDVGDSGQPEKHASKCEGARYAENLGDTSKPPESNFQLESLILAQNERWRQA